VREDVAWGPTQDADVPRQVTGETEDISDVTQEEFMNGLILLMAAIHDSTLRVAREIDTMRDV